MPTGIRLALFSAAAAAGLGYLALEMGSSTEGPQHSVQIEPEPTGATESSRPDVSQDAQASGGAALPDAASGEAEPSEVGLAELTTVASTAQSLAIWEIFPMNERGQPLPEAEVTARQGDEVLTGIGRIRWTSVNQGAWDLRCEAKGLPVWEGKVNLEGGSQRQRTAVRIGHGFSITGTVTDTAGRPVARTPLLLRSLDKSAIDEEPIETVTDSRGHFRAQLPRTARYGLALGDADAVRWVEEGPGTKLWNGGPQSVSLTVPALAHLTLEFEDEPAERPSRVDVFAFDAELAASQNQFEQERLLREAQKQEKRMAAEIAAKNKLKNAQAKAGDNGAKRARPRSKPLPSEAARNGGSKQGTAQKGAPSQSSPKGSSTAQRPRKGKAERRRRGASRQGSRPGSRQGSAPGHDALLGPGWQRIQTVAVDAATIALLDLPEHSLVKLVFRRGGSRHGASSPLSFRPGEGQVASVKLPSMPSQPTPRETMLAVLTRRSAEEKSKPALSPGVVWE